MRIFSDFDVIILSLYSIEDDSMHRQRCWFPSFQDGKDTR
jgi:hypothetical protein